MSFVAQDSHFVLLGVLFTCVALAFWLERFEWARRLSATLLAISIPLVLSNLGVIPRRAPVYDFISTYFVPTAIPLLLFKADLKRIFSETGRTLVAYCLAVVGTIAGVLVALFLIPVGADAAAIAAVHTGGYIGGSVNFVAVAQMVGLDEPTRFSAVLGAETSLGLLYLLVLSVAPATAWFSRWAESAPESGPRHLAGWNGAAPPETEDEGAAAGTSLMTSAGLLGLSLLICGLGGAVARLLDAEAYTLLFITALAVLAANVGKHQLSKTTGDVEMGMLLMFVFFGVFGASTDLGGLVRNAPVLLLFSATIVAVHTGLVFGLGRLIGLEAREVAIASNACVLGPPTAAAEAARNGWDDLVTPGLLCGILGYAVGNFLGVLLFGIVTGGG